MVDFSDVRLVVAVAEEGSLTRAAARLHVTPSALSHRLRKLEARLETPLFRRLGRRMTSTAAGERLAEGSRAALSALDDAVAQVRQMASGRRRHVLRIATQCYTCYHWLPRVLRALQEDLEDVEVRVMAEATRRPIPALLDGALDLAVVSGPIADRRLEELPLFHDDVVLVMSPAHRLARRAWVAPDDLAGEHLLIYDVADEESTVLREFLTPAGVRPRRLSKLQLTEAILELVKAGLGVTALARWAAAPAMAAGQVACARLGERGLRRHWRAVIPGYRSTPVYVRRFAHLLSERMSEPAV